MTKAGTMCRVVVLFRSHRRRLLAIAFIVIVTSGLIVVNPLLIKPVFDKALFCGRNCPNLPLLSYYVGAMIATAIVLGVAQAYLTNVLGQRVMQDLRNRLYAHLQRMPLRFFAETKAGEIQSRLTNDVGGIQTIVTDTASSIMSNVVIIASTVSAMLILSWQLTVFSCALTPVFIWRTTRIGKIRRTTASYTQQTMADLATLSHETLSVSGVLLTKSFGRQPEEIARFRERNAQLADLQIRQQMIGRGSFAAMGVFFSAAPALVYLASGVFGTHGITAGTLAAYSSLQSRLFYPLGALLNISTQVQSSLALFERIFAYLDLPHEIVDAPGATDLPPAQMRCAVSLRTVSFRYPAPNGATSRPWTLSDLTLDIAPGQLAAIVGSSGSGKTTLSYLLPRLYDLTTGAVLIDGHDVRQLRLHSWPEPSAWSPRTPSCSTPRSATICAAVPGRCWWSPGCSCWRGRSSFCGPSWGPPSSGEWARCAVPAESSAGRADCSAPKNPE